MKFKPGLLIFSLLILLTLPTLAQQDELTYKNPVLPIEQRVEDLLARMTAEEKIGQMTLVEKGSILMDDIGGLFIGGLLSGGGGYPRPNTPEAWAEMVNGFQAQALGTRLGIPLIYGADGVHGHNNAAGTVIFPHQVGLGATNNPELVEQICQITAQEMMATGIYWNYAPVLAVPQDIRWGRTYEAYSENTDLVSSLGTACIRGMQSGSPFVLATPKHFVGDGGTAWGTSVRYSIDQGVTDADEATLRALHLPPYRAAIEAGAMSIMASFSSWGGMKMSAQHYLLTDVLKGELGFQGFIVSDWAAIDQISGDYYADVVTAINAGIDMNMVPYDYNRFINVMKTALDKGDISSERLDDAVRRILRVKFMLGLFEHPLSDPMLLSQVGSDEHRALAREAVSQSLVLLKNENAALPLTKAIPTMFVAGEAADDIGLQSGGWTIEWQGKTGDITPGTTILQGIQNTLSADTQVFFDRLGRFKNAKDSAGSLLNADVGIVVVGEQPYAEGEGDAADLTLVQKDRSILERVRERVKTLIVIVVSGRPLILTDQLTAADAVVAAWLPGTEGQGIADNLFGDHAFTGKLPYTWPHSMEQIPFDFASLPAEGEGAPLFPFGYGLTTGS